MKQDLTLPPKFTVPEIINHLKNDLGVTFNYVSENDASEFLHKNNYYFRLKQYMNNFDNKTKKGKFINLDFGHLVELSTIDMYFRKLILKMTIDLEHYLKVGLVNTCQTNLADNGYDVVYKFLSDNPKISLSINSINAAINYEPNIPKEDIAVWNIVELLGFYDFISFYIFYHKYFNLNCDNSFHLDCVRRLRNSAAHNSCMLSSLNPVPNFKFDTEVCFDLLQSGKGLNPNVISSSMKVPVLNDFAIMLHLYNKNISSKRIKQITIEELKEFFTDRVIYHKEYFSENTNIKNAYNFAMIVINHYTSI